MSTENILAVFSQNVMFDQMEKEYNWSEPAPEKGMQPQSELPQKPQASEVPSPSVDEEERENVPPRGQLQNEGPGLPISSKVVDGKPEGEKVNTIVSAVANLLILEWIG